MKLKTLKDIDCLQCTDKNCNGDDYCESYLRSDLKQEAIKWIKERINLCAKCTCLGDWSQLIACEEHKFWMERFNITDKDLK